MRPYLLSLGNGEKNVMVDPENVEVELKIIPKLFKNINII